MNILSRFWQWLGSQPEDRAAVIHRNRSEGAKKAWQTRKARRSMAVKMDGGASGTNDDARSVVTERTAVTEWQPDPRD